MAQSLCVAETKYAFLKVEVPYITTWVVYPLIYTYIRVIQSAVWRSLIQPEI